MKVGKPGAHRGSTDVEHDQINVCFELEPFQ